MTNTQRLLPWQFLLFLFLSNTLFAQETTVFSDLELSYKRGLDLFDKGVYGQSQNEFAKIIKKENTLVSSPITDQVMMKSKLFYAKNAIRMNQPDGEKLILDFVKTYATNPLAGKAVLEAGNFYYNTKDYDKANKFYNMVDRSSMSKKDRTEISFKKGYGLFVKKKFSKAQNAFRPLTQNSSDYYYPANYYYGMCQFFLKQYTGAIASFKKVEQNKKYRKLTPYYITQIYFSQGQFEETIAYGLKALENNNSKKAPEIKQLIGQSYFELEKYGEALPFLEAYAQNRGKRTPDDFYQLGFVQHHTKQYKKAIMSLRELIKEDSPLAQNAMHILADSYLNIGKKSSAKLAFHRASQLKYDKEIAKESLWNYGKLSYELKADQDAINVFKVIPKTSPHYSKAQELMSSIFMNSSNYEEAITTMEAMQPLNSNMKKAYQKVLYFRGIQLLKENKNMAASSFFNRAIEVNSDAKITALSHHWLGEIQFNEGKLDNSKYHFNSFLNTANSITTFPDEASPATAHYSLGYGQLKQKKYVQAKKHFSQVINYINKHKNSIQSPNVKHKIYNDAVVRLADCFFKENDYSNATKYYNFCVNSRTKDKIYAQFQLGIIAGLAGDVATLESSLGSIISNHPKSSYADNALFELGKSQFNRGENERALNSFKNLRKNYASSPLLNSSILSIALIYYNMGEFERSAKTYKSLFKNNPSSFEAKTALQGLEEIYVKEWNDYPGYMKYRNSLKGYSLGESEKQELAFEAAYNQYKKGNYDLAIANYKKYIKKYPNGQNTIKAIFHIAESYLSLKNYDSALDYYEQLINKGQNAYYGKAVYKSALISYEKKDYKKALNYYQKLELIANTEDFIFDAQLGVLRSAYHVGNQDLVYKYSEKVIQNDKASNEQKAAANFFYGKIALEKNQFAKANSAFDFTILHNQGVQAAEAGYLQNHILFLKKDYLAAKEQCMNAPAHIKRYPFWMAKTILLLGDILMIEKEYLEARAAYQAVESNFTKDKEINKIVIEKLKLVNQKLNNTSNLAKPLDDSSLEMDEE